MSTSALIIVKTKQAYVSCTCSFDGYLTGVGQILKQKYSSKQLALNLVNKGNYDGLDEVQLNSFPYSNDSLSALLFKFDWVNYIYLFENNKWALIDKDSHIRLYWNLPQVKK